MGRSDLAFGGRGIAIVAAKFLLDLYRSDRRVHLNRGMKTLVIGRAQIVEKFTRPGTAIAPVGIETRIEAKRGAGNDRNQVFAGLQLLQFGVVLNARQIHPVDLLILQQQRFARRTKHRIPAKAAKVSATDSMSATRRNVAVQSKSRRTDGGQQKKKCRALNPTFHEVASKLFLARSQGA